MKRLCTLIILLCGLLLFPCTISYAEVTPGEIIGGTTVPEAVLVDRDGVKITAKGLSMSADDMSEISLVFNIQNTRDEDLIIFADDCSVNSLQVHSLDVFDIPGQSSADYEFEIEIEELEMYHIEHIMTVSLNFDVNKIDYETIFETGEIAFVTSAYGQYVQQYDFPGSIIYDKNNLKITAMPQITEDYSGQIVTLYIENNTNYYVSIFDMEHIVVNGKTVEGDFYARVNAGKKSMEAFSIPWQALAKNGIVDINSVGISLYISSGDPIFTEHYGNRGVGYLENAGVKF